MPSSRIWLGNIAATATQRCVRQIFGKFGHLTDAAVFPARIGPLGYAFVNFEQVGHAMRAYDMLNNAVVPLLTGNKQLKMRFKPAKVSQPQHCQTGVLRAACYRASMSASSGVSLWQADQRTCLKPAS